MKYTIAILTILCHSLLYAQEHSHVEDLAYAKDPSITLSSDLEDTALVKKYRLHTVKKYVKHYGTDKGTSANAKYELEYAYVFDKNGRSIKTTYPNDPDEGDKKEHELYYRSQNYEIDSFNAAKQIIGRTYFVDGVYAYKERFVYDSSGNMMRTFKTDKNNNTTLENATQYDAKGNILESFWDYGPYNMNRWVFQYNAQGKQVSRKGYKYFTDLTRVDSATYDAHGKKTGYYRLDRNNDKLIVTEKYIWMYDDKDNLISEKVYHSQPLYSKDTFLYDNKRQLMEKQHTCCDSWGEITRTSYSYYTSGLVKEMIGYKTDETPAWAIKLEYTVY